jgi:hypothetical protein
MKKNILTIIVFFNIFLLVNLIISTSYNIHKTEILQEVSAETSACCTKTNSGAICQDVSSAYPDCSEKLIPTKCEDTADCKIGCCIDESEGLCTTQAPKEKCEEEGGVWKSDSNCNLLECKKGCCVSGGEVNFMTEQRCEKLFGPEKDFRSSKTEFDCLALAENQNEGACVFENGICKFTTESECEKFGGEFANGDLCSKPSLNTSCEKQQTIGCLEGKDEIYWFDSCGNRENIYSSEKDASWNNGIVLDKEQSCNPNSANINSKDCGNCDSFSGSRCSETSLGKTSVKEGNYICKNLNCIDENGKERINGESWCVYDSYIGDGKDTVGSRHWKEICTEGEIKIEPCADYRGQICVQVETSSDKGNISNAACVVNDALKCLNYNSADINECSKNEDCMIKNINVDSGFQFDVCVGRYPRGFDLTDKDNGPANQICSLATQTCIVLYEKDFFGNWHCVKNCACETSLFTQQMNDLCISLGDCGTYINYIGDGTNNIKVKNAPDTSWENYKQYAENDENNYAKPKSLEYLLGKILGMQNFNDINQTQPNTLGEAVKFIGNIAGGAGTLVSAASFITGKSLFYAAGYKGIAGSGFFVGSSSASTGAGVTNVAGAFSGAAAGAAIGALAAGYLAQLRGIQGTAAAVMTLGGAVAGAAIGYSYTTGASLTSTTGLLGLSALGWTAVIALIVIAYITIIGWGQTKTVEVKFECLPWQAPLGGNNCEKCNDNPLKPCSEYKCSSLGKACKLVNQDTEKPICISVTDDTNAPKISFNSIDSNFTFMEVEDKKAVLQEDNKECITEFTPLTFSLKTDKYAQCKYSFARTDNYEAMPEYALEKNSFSLNHTFQFSIPSLDSLSVYNVVGDLKEKYGNLDMYIRCEDYFGNVNLDEYDVKFCINQGPDITPAKITATEPGNNAYLKYGETELPINIYLSEPAECKYDSYDKIYDSMANKMDCDTELIKYTDFGWKCSATLKGLSSEEDNTFYLRCKDQPWLVSDTVITVDNETNETIIKTRNINTESFVYTLKNSKSNLKIDSLSPSGNIEIGLGSVTINLDAQTSGGAKEGEALCYYQFSDGDKILFFDTSSEEHKQKLNLGSGEYFLDVQCEDEAGNIANAGTKFSINVDDQPPAVVRVYSVNGQLKLITDEEAECYYDFYRCNFDINNATSMTLGLSTQHSAKKISGKTYYIKCIDAWGNQEDGCTIKVQAV